MNLSDVLKYGHHTVLKTVDGLPDDAWQQGGVCGLPWYGAEYSLVDFVVYTFYGHKREHCAQIALFKKRLA